MATLRNRPTFTSSSDSVRRRKNRVLPSAEDIYISLTSEQLDMIGRSRLIQDDTEYSMTSNNEVLQTLEHKENVPPTCLSLLENSNSKNAEDQTRKKKIIHPEPELSNPHHIPFHLRDNDEQISYYGSYIIPHHKSVYKDNYWNGASLTYSATRNSVDIVTIRQFFGVHRSDSLFKYVFSKFRDL